MNKKYFETRFVYKKGRDSVWKAISEDLQQYISSSDVVLDIGTGYGNFINNIKAGEKHAADMNRDVKKYMDEDVKFHAIDATKVGTLLHNHFDVVFASNFLEHLGQDELDTFFSGVKKILKKKGRVIFVQPNYRYCADTYWDDYTHKTVFTHISLADYLETKGFHVKVMKKKYVPFSMKVRVPKSYWLTKLYLKMPIN